MRGNFEWLKELNDIDKLEGDYKTIVELIGLDNFINLLEYFNKTAIYFSTQPLIPLQKQYITENCEKPIKDIARALGVSERFVYNQVSVNELDRNQIDMFQEQD